MAEVSEVQNLNPDDNVPVDETPPASDTQHVSQGEPRDYTGPFEEDREYFSDSDTPYIP